MEDRNLGPRSGKNWGTPCFGVDCSLMPVSEAQTRRRYATDFRYTNRQEKARYIGLKYAPILHGRVLDVGCDQRQLAMHLSPGAAYVGVDMNSAADVVLNLDRENLPFADRSFDTVLCCDVLEHLERCHAVFDELCRVSASRVIISLPNCVRNLVLGLFDGSRGRMKHYGLPSAPPADRHRWFFGYDEACAFARERGERNGYAIEQVDPEDVSCYYWLGRDGKDVLDHQNITHGTMWCVLRRAELR